LVPTRFGASLAASLTVSGKYCRSDCKVNTTCAKEVQREEGGRAGASSAGAKRESFVSKYLGKRCDAGVEHLQEAILFVQLRFIIPSVVVLLLKIPRIVAEEEGGAGATPRQRPATKTYAQQGRGGQGMTVERRRRKRRRWAQEKARHAVGQSDDGPWRNTQGPSGNAQRGRHGEARAAPLGFWGRRHIARMARDGRSDGSCCGALLAVVCGALAAV
jgi:hypothetical protein